MNAFICFIAGALAVFNAPTTGLGWGILIYIGAWYAASTVLDIIRYK